MLSDHLRDEVLRSGDYGPVSRAARYLDDYKWRPAFVLRRVGSPFIVAFEVVQSTALRTRVLEEAKRAQDEHDDLAVVMLVKIDVATSEVAEYCAEQGFGLWVFSGSVIRPIAGGRHETEPVTAPAPSRQPGWIPPPICEHAACLTKVRAAPLIAECLPELSNPRTGVRKATAIVEETLERIMQDQRERLADSLRFYDLAGMERLLGTRQSLASEHTIHSFRVYISGAVILDHFWDFFRDAWTRYVGPEDARIDDVWFLASMFHDCAYARHPEMRAAAARVLELGDSIPMWPPDDLSRRDFQWASRLVASFLSHLRRAGHSRAQRWDVGAGAPEGPIEKQMRQSLVRWYRSRQFHHGVVGALDLAADMVKSVQAAKGGGDDAVDRSFLVWHVYPAAAAVALHHHGLWEAFRKVRLFPLQARHYPLAGLLIYLDTWDEFRRKPGAEMAVTAFDLARGKATVQVHWADAGQAKQAQFAYDSYRENVVWPREMKLEVELNGGGRD